MTVQIFSASAQLKEQEEFIIFEKLTAGPVN